MIEQSLFPLKSLFAFFSFVWMAIGACIAFLQYRKSKNISTFLLGLMLFLDSLALFGEGWSYSHQSIVVVQITILLYIPLCFCVIFFLDSVTRDSVDPKKIFLATLLSMNTISHVFQKNIIRYNPDLHIDKSLLYNLEIMNMYTGLLIFLYLLNIYIKSPLNLKKPALICLIGAISFTIIPSIFVITFASSILSGFHLIIQTIGALLILIPWIKNKQLAFVLTFEAIRLDIINSKSGIPLYTYIWNQNHDLVEPTLYSGLITGLTSVLNESVNRGNIQQIVLENAAILIYRSEKSPISAIFLTTKTSKYLHRALSDFIEAFIKRYPDAISEFIDIHKFNTAKELVATHFAFVPKYNG